MLPPAEFSSLLVAFLLLSVFALYRAVRKRARARRATVLSRSEVAAAYGVVVLGGRFLRRLTMHLDVVLPVAALVVAGLTLLSLRDASAIETRLGELEAQARSLGIETVADR